MHPSLLAMLAVILAGGVTALQAPTNAKLATAVGSPINAALVSFVVGTVALALMAAIEQARPDISATRSLPWYAWVGGLYGVCFVLAAIWGVPRLGVALTVTLLVAGQLVLSLALDHFGFMDAPRQPISPGRILGVTLVLGGVLLVRRF